MVRTLKFKINPDKDMYLSMMDECSELFNDYVDWSYKNNTWNKQKCHHDTYNKAREKYPNVPSALIQNTRDIALESCKAVKLHKSKKPKKHSNSIRIAKHTGYRIKGNLIEIITPIKRKRYRELLHIPDYYKDIYESEEWKNKGATIIYIKKTKQFWIHISFEKETPPKREIKDTNRILGIDRGLYNLCSLSNGKNFSSNKLSGIRSRYAYTRSTLQSQGTLSAKRRLKSISGKEKRFRQDVDHCISKQIVKMDYDVFVLEDLKNIRKKCKGKKKLNNWMGNWSFYQFQKFLEYKSEELGKSVVYVDPSYTSQKCSKCGHISKSNRNKSKFKCIKCGFEENSDINASKNIKDKYISTLDVEEGSTLNPDISPINSVEEIGEEMRVV